MNNLYLIAIIIGVILQIISYLIVKKLVSKHLATASEDLIKFKPITPENTIIVFDFHDVLVNYDYPNIIKKFWANDKKFKIIIGVLNPIVLFEIIKLKSKKAVSEQYIISLGKKHTSLEPYIPLGIEIANTQKINYDMLNLLKTLKNTGYELHLFSNIGDIIYQNAKQKFPEIFSCFSKIIVPSQENGYIRKPFDNAFANYLEQTKNENKQIIFMDDKITNIVKARKQGMIGILFQNYNQLTQEFKKLGVLK